MAKRNKNRANRIRNLMIITALTAIVISVSTYAWFVGMRTVNVSSFDVEIASTDSLLLSLDGDTWDTTVNISQATYNSASYLGNTNTWGGRGLIPMSSVGDMDNSASRMILYEKASLTTTPGGYRLMASRANNTGALEQDGYIAFDLFVKNFSGTQYISDLEPLDEEAIYLTTDSKVKVAADGVADTGIENSVRVAFAQIGRVAGTTNVPATITGITCTSAGAVTGICRTAQIWEPNDIKHVANAISWYTTSCRPRTGGTVTSTGSYDTDGTCNPVVNGNTYNTYAVNTAITSADNVDIYDGPHYNGYVVPDPDGEGPLVANPKLTAYPYFTDTMKDLLGTSRPTFVTLAPNSITKVRVYIYIEGQDIDNYDFASIGKKISVGFGFTKERYTEDDINYPENGGPDFTPPVITLNGNSPMTLTVGDTYTEPEATATDNRDGDVTEDIVKTGVVDTATVGVYYVTYNVSDAAGNVASKVVRTVIVQAAE